MRIIKFRTWDDEKNVWLFFGLPWAKRDDISEHIAPLTVDQSTGLTDKGGKEIFEGDIIAWETIKVDDGGNWDGRSTKKLIEVVEWNADQGKYDGVIGRRLGEVIGNIHENPKLLQLAE